MLTVPSPTIREMPGYRTLVPVPLSEPPTAEALLASPDGMRAWLAQLEPTAEVGWSQSIYYCPIATYLGSEGIATWVGSEVAGPCGSMLANVRLPNWAQRLVALVDRYEYQPIRASLALALMHQSMREIGL